MTAGAIAPTGAIHMAGDFEDTYDLENLSDRELRDLVREHLEASTALDIDDITVRVEDGVVVLEGRVGDAGEEQVAEHVLTDILGITNFRNELVADPIRRAESPMAIDDHLAEEERHEGLLLGDRAVSLTDESEHLADSPEEEAEGTTDVGKAIEGALPWIPPESPTPEGISRDARSEDA
ncbi:MAG TPA: BON domain-containing protein [Gemmatimonadaceae bacterium]|nr:BON domain-containing protein [Gemmatimonadaceae bacterium]